MKLKTKLTILFSSITAILLVFCALVATAYFKTRIKLYTNEGSKTYYRVGMELNTFFDMINSGTTPAGSTYSAVSLGQDLKIVCTDTSLATLYSSGDMETGKLYYKNFGTDTDPIYHYVYNNKATWGSASNPYLISKVNHLQNLYVLQNCGYFTNLTGNGNDANKLKENCMPYFLVSTSVGTPVTINGENKTYEYIGNDAFPFIGYLGGSFVTGTTTVNGQNSDQSVIYNLTVNTAPDVVDVGLFGNIGYLGDEKTVQDGQTTFDGSVSTVRDILLYDVKVSVTKKTVWEAIVDATKHLFSFSSSELGSIPANTVPHENHHIGILAGHVEYATIEYVSVYYSSTTIPAIDVNMTTKDKNNVDSNFKSVSGILGFVHKMNSVHSSGKISVDSGIDNKDIEVSSGGVGTGGGLLSGTGRGYVTAKEIYDGYDDSGNIVHYKMNSLDSYSLIIYADKAKGSTGIVYSLPDNSSITVSGNDTNGYSAEITTSYQRFITTTTQKDTFDNIVIAYPNGSGYDYYYRGITKITETLSTNPIKYVESTGLYLRMAAGNVEGQFEKLCTQYVRDRIIAGTKVTNRFYFYDGVFTFALSDASDTIDETWPNGVENNNIYVGVDSDSSWTKDATGGDGAVVAFIKQVKDADDLEEAKDSGKQIFILYQDSSGNHLVTLNGNSTYVPGGGNNALLTNSTTLQFTEHTLTNKLVSALSSGTMSSPVSGITASDLAEGLGDGTYKALNVGATTELESTEMLNTKYGIDIGFTPNTATSTFTVDGNNDKTGTDVENLDAAAKAVGNTKYKTDTSVSINTELGITYFLPSTMSTVADLSAINSAISTKNSTIYRDDWSTPITDSVITNAVANNTAITQTETHTYDGYFYFNTQEISYRVFYYQFKLRLYYVDANGTPTEITTTSSVKYDTWEAALAGLFSSTSTSSIDGKTLYKRTFKLSGKNETKELPLLYELDGSYYESWTYVAMNDDGLASSGSAVSFVNKKYVSSYTATYNYFVATHSVSGISYTVNGTKTSANGVPQLKSEKVSSIKGHTIPATNGYDYNLYTDGTTTGILITKFYFNGYITKTMTGTGVKYFLNGSDEAFPESGEPTVFENAKNSNITISAGGNDYTVYKVGNALGVLVSNYQIDGVILAVTKASGTSYSMYGGSVMSGASCVALTDNSGNEIKYNIGGTNYNLYLCGGKLGVLASTEEVSGYYNFSSKNTSNSKDPYSLRLLARQYVTWMYSIMCSTDDYVKSENMSQFSTTFAPCNNVANSKNAIVTFDGDGSCRIRYTVRSTDYYLNFVSSVDVSGTTYYNQFNGSNSATSSSTKMYIYTVEGMHEVSNGRLIVPTDEGEIANLSAGSFVLWPNTEKSTSTSYTIKQLQQDGVPQRVNSNDDYLTSTEGWKSCDGNSLTINYLSKKFNLRDKISEITIYNILNGEVSFDTNAKYVRAPVGTNGEEAFIPSGCVSFRVNKAGMNQKIRVIVAVPQTTFYYNEPQGTNLSDDYRFGMWYFASNGTSLTISMDTAQTWFSLPKSYQYDPTLSIADANPSALSIVYNGTTYRTYLNGSKVLVAYEFTCNEEGIYMLGANQSCQIVYFSADSSASSGDDGTTSYKMGTIDYVYDNSYDTSATQKVITVKDAQYTPSYSLLYTDNSNLISGDTDCHSPSTDFNFPNINDFAIYLKRNREVSGTSFNEYFDWHAVGGTKLTSGEIVDAVYVQFVRYSLDADSINRGTDEERSAD